MARKRNQCPGCDGQKIVAARLCKQCEMSRRTGSSHPNWRGGRYESCPECGRPMNRGSLKCRTCVRVYPEGYNPSAAERQRDFRRTPNGRRHVRAMNLKKFGLTPELYDVIFRAQDGHCAACGQQETHRNQYGVVSLAVDHDHITGKVRGLLCGRCNRALGLLGDSLERIEGLRAYRERW